MKRLFFTFGLSLVVTSQILSQAVSYPIDASHSVISFSVGFAGDITSIDGRFDVFEGTIGYKDVSNPSTLFVSTTIDVKSINTGDKQRDEDLQGVEFFNSEQYPEITFISKKAIKTDEGYIVTGTFSMLGNTSEIDIQFTLRHESTVVWVFGEPRIAIEGHHTIDRMKYSIPKRGWDNIIPSLGSMTLSNDVNVKIVVQGVGLSLSALIQEKISSDGVPEAIALYKDLEKKESDKGTYTFGDRTLLSVIMSLTRGGKNEEAISIGEFCTTKYADSFRSWYGLASAYQASGNIEKAILSYKKTLSLNPEFTRAQTAIDKLKE